MLAKAVQDFVAHRFGRLGRYVPTRGPRAAGCYDETTILLIAQMCEDGLNEWLLVGYEPGHRFPGARKDFPQAFVDGGAASVLILAAASARNSGALS